MLKHLRRKETFNQIPSANFLTVSSTNIYVCVCVCLPLSTALRIVIYYLYKRITPASFRTILIDCGLLWKHFTRLCTICWLIIYVQLPLTMHLVILQAHIKYACVLNLSMVFKFKCIQQLEIYQKTSSLYLVLAKQLH